MGNRGPGDSEPGDTWISLNNHLNYVAGSIGHHLPHLRTDPATNAVDNQGPALAAPCLGKCESSHGKFQSLNSKLAPTLATKPEKKSRYTFSIKERHYRLICKISRKKQKNTKGICHSSIPLASRKAGASCCRPLGPLEDLRSRKGLHG